MLDLTERVLSLRQEVLERGPVRKKLSVILWDWLGQRQKKSAAVMRQFDQLLLENDLAVYTSRYNVRQQQAVWDWPDLRSNHVFITFIQTPTSSTMPPNNNLLKRQVINEPWPTEGLFALYASKAREILICAAYVDEVMTDLLVDIARRHHIKVRFVADIGYNSNPHKRPIIRAKLETIGTFRTLAGTDAETGIMHLKLYVFYNPDDTISVFNTSANFTANAWKFVNHEAPVTIQTAPMQDPEVSILVNAAERMWQKSEGTAEPAFQQNDKVTHASFGTGQVLQLNGPNIGVLFGGSNFQFVPASDLQFLIDPLERLANGTFTPRDTVPRTKAKFLAHYLHAQNSLTNEFYDFRIKPVPHQLLALKRAVTSRNGGNLLLADDVGLGKTIEAGLIIQNLVRRRGEDKARVLVMCPAGLKWQWYEEMRDKFGLQFNIWKLHTVGGAEAFSGGFHGHNRLIASYHGMTVGEMENAILRAIEKYDLVIIDECHRFANEATQWWQLARDLREQNKVGQLLLLSATPHSGDQYKFLNLLHLLDRETFAKGHGTQESLRKLDNNLLVTEYVYRNDKLSVTDFDKKPLFRNVSTLSVSVELTAAEQDFCQLVVEYIYALNDAKKAADSSLQTQIGFVVSMYRKMLASSWKNVFRSMQARYRYLLQQASEENNLGQLFDNDEETDEREERKIDNLIKEMKSKQLFSEELEMLERIVTAGRALSQQNVDTKVQRLLSLVNQAEHADKKFIIFTQFVKTLEVIKEALGGHEYVAEIQGSKSIEERKKEIEKFRNRVRFMICTEAGGEGINLQFASNVVNFDMPWNPAASGAMAKRKMCSASTSS
jgi:superfamily II DNA or RNA helicase